MFIDIIELNVEAVYQTRILAGMRALLCYLFIQVYWNANAEIAISSFTMNILTEQ